MASERFHEIAVHISQVLQVLDNYFCEARNE